MHILLACPSSLHCMQCSCTTHASLRDVMNACNELPQSSRHYERRAVTRRPVHAWITDGAWITVCLLRIRMPQASSLLIRAQAMQLPPACGAVLSCPLQSNVPPPPGCGLARSAGLCWPPPPATQLCPDPRHIRPAQLSLRGA